MRSLIAVVALAALMTLSGCTKWSLVKEWQEVNQWSRNAAPHFPGGNAGQAQARTVGGQRVLDGQTYNGVIELQQRMSDGSSQTAFIGLRPVDDGRLWECGGIHGGGAPEDILRNKVNQFMATLAEELRDKYPSKNLVRGYKVEITDDYLKVIAESE